MSNQIYVSTGSFKYENLEDIIETCIENRIANLELSSGIPYSNITMDIVYKNRLKFNFLVHNYFPPPSEPFVLNLATSDPKLLDQSLQHCRHAIDLTAYLGGKFYSVHSGFTFHATPEMLGKEGVNYSYIPMKQANTIFLTSINKLVEHAKSRNIMLLIENNVISVANLIRGNNLLGLGVTANNLVEIIKEINSPFFGLLFDTGHLKVSANALGFNCFSFIDKIKDYVKLFHVHDNDGVADTHQPIQPDSWVLDVLRHPKFAGLPIVVEAKFKNINDLCEHVNWLQMELEK